MENLMKNIIFALSLLTIVSANILYPMERPTNSHRQADSPNLVYKCPSRGCKETFGLESNLRAHVQQKHTLNGMTMLSGFESEKDIRQTITWTSKNHHIAISKIRCHIPQCNTQHIPRHNTQRTL